VRTTITIIKDIFKNDSSNRILKILRKKNIESDMVDSHILKMKGIGQNFEICNSFTNANYNGFLKSEMWF